MHYYHLSHNQYQSQKSHHVINNKQCLKYITELSFFPDAMTRENYRVIIRKDKQVNRKK